MTRDSDKEKIKKPITFEDKEYFTEPRFLSYFSLLVISLLFSIYIIELLIDPDGIFFIQIALLVSGGYFIAFIFGIKQAVMP